MKRLLVRHVGGTTQNPAPNMEEAEVDTLPPRILLLLLVGHHLPNKVS